MTLELFLRRSRAALTLAAMMASAAAPHAETPATPAHTNTVALANRILDRWEPAAREAGAHWSGWREMFATQLTMIDVSVLRSIDRVKIVDAANAGASYAQFLQAIRGAEMELYRRSSAKPEVKLGSPTADQVFVPIAPCRIVDTRKVGGPISAGNTRNFVFYSTGNAYDWSGQGGIAGPSGTSCPGTILPNGGVYAPSGAFVTVTVVSPTAPGNWIIWGGANPKPTISALNWNAGDVIANTTLIPEGGRSGTGPGGSVLDFAVAYNGPSGSADFVADVVGYLVENRSTALDCYETALATAPIASVQTASVDAFACSVGWTLTKGNCDASRHDSTMFLKREGAYSTFPQANWSCTYENLASTAETIYATSICCRVPGR